MFPRFTIIISLFLFSFFNSLGQIQWDSASKLTWDNFKGPPNELSSFKANTFCAIECEYGYSDSCFSFEVKAVFSEKKSWYIDSSKILLDHERGHFDIAEIYARMIRKYLKRNSQIGLSEDEIKKGISLFQIQKSEYQKLYDKETNHSLIQNKQKQWRIKIDKQLKDLEQYRLAVYDSCNNSL